MIALSLFCRIVLTFQSSKSFKILFQNRIKNKNNPLWTWKSQNANSCRINWGNRNSEQTMQLHSIYHSTFENCSITFLRAQFSSSPFSVDSAKVRWQQLIAISVCKRRFVSKLRVARRKLFGSMWCHYAPCDVGVCWQPKFFHHFASGPFAWLTSLWLDGIYLFLAPLASLGWSVAGVQYRVLTYIL